MNSRLPAARRLVLGIALAAALAAWLVPHTTFVRAAAGEPLIIVQATESRTDPPVTSAAQAAPKGTATARTPAKVADPVPAADPAAATAPAAETAKPADADADAEVDEPKSADITIDKHGIRVEKGRKRVHVEAFGGDREYDSFESFVQDAPWLAGLVFLAVLLVFLVPLLIIVLLIWYKMRKNRMLNETMLKLAEKGVPPADAMAALDASQGGRPPAGFPLYEQARQFRQRAASSDLRKGVILVALGLAFSFYSMIEDGSPNGIGLVLLFLGLGYCVLWFFEDRKPAVTTTGGSVPPPGGA